MDSFASPSLPTFGLRQPSPSANSVNGGTSQTYEELRTRVSELEVINDLFRGRVAELEQTEQEARQAERLKQEEVERSRADLDVATAKLADLQKRVAELEGQGTPPRKKVRSEETGGVKDNGTTEDA